MLGQGLTSPAFFRVWVVPIIIDASRKPKWFQMPSTQNFWFTRSTRQMWLLYYSWLSFWSLPNQYLFQGHAKAFFLFRLDITLNLLMRNFCINDVIIYSPTIHEHMTYLNDIFKRLRKEKKIKSDKCESFCKKSRSFRTDNQTKRSKTKPH